MKCIPWHDLMYHSAAIIGCCLIVVVLQIVIITKSTIPADEVITELRVFRNEVSKHHHSFDRRISDIEVKIDVESIRRATIESLSTPSPIPSGN